MSPQDFPPCIRLILYVGFLNTQDIYYSKPIWFIPQAFGNQEHWNREPTGREQIAMAYLALIHGVTGGNSIGN